MKQLTLANRLIIRIMTVLIIMSAVIMIIVYDVTRKSLVRETKSRYEAIILNSNEKARGVLSDVYLGAINNIYVIEQDIENPDKLQKHLERMIRTNMYMSSCRLIFEPDFYPARGHNYEIYAWRDSLGTVWGKQMNEFHPEYKEQPWYKNSIKNEKGEWTPPYYDSSASHQLTTTFTVTIHDANGKTVGLLGADVSLEWLRLRHKRIDAQNHERNEKGFKKQSYSFIIDQNGTYVVHPDEDRVLKWKIQDIVALTPDTSDDAVIKEMMNEDNGTALITIDGDKWWMFYSFVKYAKWTIVICVPDNIIYHDGNVLATILIVIFFIGTIFILVLCYRFILSNMRPLTRFVQAANQIAKGDFSIHLPKVKSLEIDTLRSAFKDMQVSLKRYISELQETTASKVAIEQELKLASRIQMQMLPKTFPPYPKRNDIDIFGEVETAKEVGGDFFDFFIRDEKLFFCIGDVSGKGMPASLIMAVARSMFRSTSMIYTSPKLIVQTINQSSCENNDSFMFVTFFMGVLDLATGNMSYVNAGHEPPIIIEKDARFLPVVNNIPLGLRADWDYAEQTEMIDSDTTIFLYTDGFTETTSKDKKRYNRNQMLTDVIRLAKEQLDAHTFVKRIRQMERDFVGFIQKKDDISLFAIKYKGNHHSGTTSESIHLRNDIRDLPLLKKTIDDICNNNQLEGLARSSIQLAIEEAVVNVMEHAFPKETEGDIYLTVNTTHNTLQIELRDNGMAFDPTLFPKVDIDLNVEQRKIGGLGIHLIRHYMDELHYERKDNQNILYMTKKLSN